MYDDIDTDRDQSRDEQQCKCTRRRARARERAPVRRHPARALVLFSQVTEDQHDPEHRAEQDELLPERVKSTEVKIERRDQVRGVAQAHADPVEHAAVDPVVVAEGRKPREPKHEHDAERRGRHAEQQQPRGPAHQSSGFSGRLRSCSCSCTFRSASRIITGRPTVETTISDSATSGA